LGRHTVLDAEGRKRLQGILQRWGTEQGNVIPILQELQEAFGYVPQEAVREVAQALQVPESRFFGVATFYAQFYFSPRGRHIITACSGTACHVKGSERLVAALMRELHIPEGQDTSSDGEFTVQKVNCVGACSIAPVVIIDKEVKGKVSLQGLLRELKKLKGAKGKDG
jgi:NADH:ubiquinone oxidoreductase subunit E